MTKYAITPEDYDALVRESNLTSPAIAPGDAALVLFEESAGFDPTNPGPPRASPPVGGLNQMSEPNLTAMGLARDAWLRMSAAEQLPHVFAFWRSLAKSFNGGDFPHDAPTILALNFLPGSYMKQGAKTNPDAAIAAAAGPYANYYHDNPALDPDRTGKISVNTIAKYLSNVASDPRNAARWGEIQTGIHDALQRRPTPIPKPPPPLPDTPPGPPAPPAPAPSSNVGKVGLLAVIIAAILAAIAAARGGH